MALPPTRPQPKAPAAPRPGRTPSVLTRDNKPFELAPEHRGNNFGSKVQTGNPFGGSESRMALQYQPHYTGMDQSRSAFARALSDSARNEGRAQFNDATRQYQQEGEQIRARDTQARREDALNRYSLEREKRYNLHAQNVRKAQGMADMAAYLDRAKKDARANTVGNIATMAVTAAMLPFSQPVSAMVAAAKGSGGAMATAGASLFGSGMGGFGNRARAGTLSLLGGLR